MECPMELQKDYSYADSDLCFDIATDHGAVDYDAGEVIGSFSNPRNETSWERRCRHWRSIEFGDALEAPCALLPAPDRNRLQLLGCRVGQRGMEQAQEAQVLRGARSVPCATRFGTACGDPYQ